ncbi:helix-turn-helix domain-containing protein [Cohnella zeiphila]|uniref:Helix-turn-helix transcriptional regulator n=1 Tax=Cohnella zeiphila TaxID=2761120 RepID=A0A7X0STV5_9BACL|nr:helix-turn-helix transcriptional regulator [Cohnella zeiphila]MBB6736006.1 helix-turn-helix transcriptional regulator [Cohnella zeiphila]
MHTIKQRLKHIRQASNLSMAEFGEKIGVSAGNVGDWESERRPTVPGARALVSIAETFSVSLDWLLLGKFEQTASGWEAVAGQTTEKTRLNLLEDLAGCLPGLEEEDLQLLVAIARRLQSLSRRKKRGSH